MRECSGLNLMSAGIAFILLMANVAVFLAMAASAGTVDWSGADAGRLGWQSGFDQPARAMVAADRGQSPAYCI
jgi:hypothetical protein